MIETRTVTRKVCPAEVTAALPAAIAMPVGAVIEAGAEVLRWIGARFAREEILAQRIVDAKAQCNG